MSSARGGNITFERILHRAPALSRIRQCISASQAAIFLGVVLCGVCVWGLQGTIIGLFHDDGVYVVAAKSLSEGEGYRISSLPSSPAQTKYPFLYPYILSWIWGFYPSFPENILLLKSVNVAFLFVIVLLSYFFYCINTDDKRPDACFYAFLVGANPAVFSFVDFTVSDLLFLVIALAVYCLYGKAENTRFRGSGVLVLAVLGALALWTRSAGVPFILAGVICLLWMRRFRELVIYLVALGLLVGPWVLWQTNHKTVVGPDSLLAYYLGYDFERTAFYLIWTDPARAGEMAWANFRYLLESFDIIWLLPVFPVLRLWVFAYFLVAVGMWRSFSTHSLFLRLFLALYAFMLLAWPFHPIRYAIPLIPLFLLYMFKGIQVVDGLLIRLRSVRGKIYPGMIARLPLAVIMVLTLAWLGSKVQYTDGRTVLGAYGVKLHYSWSGFEETFDWIRRHTGETDILATTFDPMFYLYTGRKSIIPAFHRPETYFYPYNHAVPDVGQAEDVKRELATLGARYLIINPQEQYAERHAIEKLMEQLRLSYAKKPLLVFTSSDGLHQVYQLPTGADH